MATLLTRNDGECHLQKNDERIYEYFRSPEQVRIFILVNMHDTDFLCLLVVESLTK